MSMRSELKKKKKMNLTVVDDPSNVTDGAIYTNGKKWFNAAKDKDKVTVYPDPGRSKERSLSAEMTKTAFPKGKSRNMSMAYSKGKASNLGTKRLIRR